MTGDSDEPTRTVRTTLPTSLHERFAVAAEWRGSTIPEAARTAIAEFADRYGPVDPADPIFAPLATEPTAGGTEDVSGRVDEILYGETE